MRYLNKNLHTYLFLYCQATDMQNDDEAWLIVFFILAKPTYRFAYVSWQSIVTFLHTCVSIMFKCIRTRNIVRPFGLHYNHYVRISIRPSLFLSLTLSSKNHLLSLLARPSLCFAYFSLQSLASVLHGRVSIMLECIRK